MARALPCSAAWAARGTCVTVSDQRRRDAAADEPRHGAGGSNDRDLSQDPAKACLNAAGVTAATSSA
jgi:hypothetical protein